MRNLLHFLAKYNRLILFILLELLAIYLISSSNAYHNARLFKGLRGLTLAWEGIATDTRNYFRIKKINEDLQAENILLRKLIEIYRPDSDSLFFSRSDTLARPHYEFIAATVVNNSVNRQKNYFTIDKGKNQGVVNNMAILSPWGPAGIIVAVSDNFSLAMSLLNLDFRLSCRIKTNDFFGSLTWDGRDYRYAILSEIPQHVLINKGDTIVTTGYSAIFPGGIITGTISDFEKTGSDFYRIRVKLATDFRRLVYVTAVKNIKREEQITIEGGIR